MIPKGDASLKNNDVVLQLGSTDQVKDSSSSTFQEVARDAGPKPMEAKHSLQKYPRSWLRSSHDTAITEWVQNEPEVDATQWNKSTTQAHVIFIQVI